MKVTRFALCALLVIPTAVTAATDGENDWLTGEALSGLALRSIGPAVSSGRISDIAVDPKIPHIRTRQVKALSRLDFVRGVKVSASRKVLGNYTRAAASFRERGEFGIYVGNAMLIFEICLLYTSDAADDPTLV